MKIAEKIISGENVTKKELKHLLWLALSELESWTDIEFVELDNKETFSIDELLNNLQG